MLKWLKARNAKSVEAAKPSLDFSNPNHDAFVASLGSWRESLETSTTQGKKLDQNDLTYMAPDALDELKELEKARRRESCSKKACHQKTNRQKVRNGC